MNTVLKEILSSCRSGRPAVMGILNMTPDSFSDGNCYFDAAAAIDRAAEMISQGADIIDIGAESTRPGSKPVSSGQQIKRIEAAIGEIVQMGRPVSIDTTSSDVARFACESGACIINDITAASDPGMLTLAAEKDLAIVLMHMQATPETMQNSPHYRDVATEVLQYLLGRVEAATAAGIPKCNCIIDPGIGFGKSLEHNLSLLGATEIFVQTQLTVLIGASRKSFIEKACGPCPTDQRLGGSLAAVCSTYLAGAKIFRVHDVAETRQCLDILQAIGQCSAGGDSDT